MGKSANHSNIKDELLSWLKTPLGLIIGIFTIFGMGFGAGVVIEKNNSTLEKIQMTQEFNKQLEQERDKYQKLNIEQYGKKISDLETVVNELKKMKNGKTR